jgi:hypothetical protein
MPLRADRPTSLARTRRTAHYVIMTRAIDEMQDARRVPLITARDIADGPATHIASTGLGAALHSPAALFQLQRSAGNAAATVLIERARVQRSCGPSCGCSACRSGDSGEANVQAIAIQRQADHRGATPFTIQRDDDPPAATSDPAAAPDPAEEADAAEVAQTPDAIAEWIAAAPSSDGGAAAGGAADGEQTTAQATQRLGYAGAGAGPTPSGAAPVALRTIQRLSSDNVAPPANKPGCCEAEYADLVAKWTDMKKGEIDVDTALDKVKVAIGIGSGGAVGGAAASAGAKGLLGKLSPWAGVAASVALLSALLDAKNANDKWTVSVTSWQQARQTYNACAAKAPSVCAPGSTGQVSAPVVKRPPANEPEEDFNP